MDAIQDARLAALRTMERHSIRELTDSQQRKVLVLRDVATWSEALRLLAEHAVLSAPVVSTCEAESPFEGRSTHMYTDEWPNSESTFPRTIGFVSAQDVLGACLEEVEEALRTTAGRSEVPRDVRMLQLQLPGVESRTLRTLPGMTDGDFLFTVEKERSVLDVVRNCFLRPRNLHLDDPPPLETRRLKGTEPEDARPVKVPRFIHRLAIVDEGQKIRDIISASDIMVFLRNHVRELGRLASMRIYDLRLGLGKEIYTVKANEPSIQAFAGMYEKGYSSAAVLSSITGIMIGNISMSDLRCLDLRQFGRLALPVSDFILYTESVRSSAQDKARTRLRDAKGRSFVRRPRLVTCTPDFTFSEVLDLLVQHAVHRIYVVDELNLPIGLITPTDILLLVAGVDV